LFFDFFIFIFSLSFPQFKNFVKQYTPKICVLKQI
jgi:hypothetical protein